MELHNDARNEITSCYNAEKLGVRKQTSRICEDSNRKKWEDIIINKAFSTTKDGNNKRFMREGKLRMETIKSVTIPVLSHYAGTASV